MIKKELSCGPVCNYKYITTKIKIYSDKYTNVYKFST